METGKYAFHFLFFVWPARRQCSTPRILLMTFLGHLLKFAVRTRSPAAEHFGKSNWREKWWISARGTPGNELYCMAASGLPPNFFGVFAYHLLTNVSPWTPCASSWFFDPKKKRKKIVAILTLAWFIASVSANQISSNVAVACGAAGAHNKFEQMAQKSESTRFA